MTVGQKTHYHSSVSNVTGESIFVDDRPLMADEVFVSFVGSPVAAGRLLAVEPSKALELPGIVGVFTHQDLKNNQWGTVCPDQPLLVSDQIGYQHEPICLIAATDRLLLDEADFFLLHLRGNYISLLRSHSYNPIMCLHLGKGTHLISS